MPSVSLPVTPQHFEKPTSGKWAATSCEELDRVTPCGSDHEFSDSPIKIAKFKALKVKREAISSFLADHFQEDLSLYIDELRTFACSAGGLVDDEFRSRIWPVLAANLVPLDEDQDYDAVSCDSDFESAASELSDLPGYAEDAENVHLDLLKEHPEWKQVELDVHRTLARFPPNISEDHRVLLQDELIPLIVRVLQTNSRFHYYQGFHDICLTMVLVCGVEKALRICCQLAHCGVFNNYLLKSLEESVLKELDLMYVILSRVDPQLEMIMRGTQLGSLFALSWPLTWFSHSLQHYQQIVRVFDVLLASQPLLPVYLSTAVVLYRRPAILTTEREMPFLHQLLSTMPNELPLDALCSDAQYLAKLMPPSLLKGRFLEDYSKIAHTPSKTAAQSKLPRYALHLLVAAGAAGFFLLAKSSIVLSDVI